jgi:hypothetical protein
MTAPMFPPSVRRFSWKALLGNFITAEQGIRLSLSDGLRLVWRGCQIMVRRVANMILLLLLFIGAGTVWDATVGDGPLPRLNNLKHQSPAWVRLSQQNTTAQASPLQIRQAYWQALSPSRRLLLSLSPQIALWLDTLHRHGHIETHEPEGIHQTYHVSADTPLLAAYRYSQDTLYLGPAFWRLSEGQKVAVLAHEYRHSRQNAGKRISYQLAQWMSMGQLQNNSPMETEAMAYEREAELALGGS